MNERGEKGMLEVVKIVCGIALIIMVLEAIILVQFIFCDMIREWKRNRRHKAANKDRNIR